MNQAESEWNVADFTTTHYRQLLELGLKNYSFVDYKSINSHEGEKVILWRHDCDFSLNRSLRLAKMEHELGIQATYFLNPHSEFYNVFERSQSDLVKEIIGLGHHIGLHFDAAYYRLNSEQALHALVAEEVKWLQQTFGVDVPVFSFHNPDEFLLSCREATYGDCMNTYSNYFRENVGYCSDSNGYWRHRRLHDVLEKAEEQKLQILTHPGWWQEDAMLPRERIKRCADGRAATLMDDYDALLNLHGRTNVR